MRVRSCSRCGVAFELVVPEKGRRLCETCRGARAVFFTCPGCGAKREQHSATRDELGRPTQCWDCRQAATAAARTTAVVDHVAGLEHGLARRAIEAAVAEAAPSRNELKWLAEQLAAHHGSLAPEDGTAPRVVCRLAAALAARGADIGQPRCGRCGMPALLVTRTSDHGRICKRCDTVLRAEPCSVCNRVRKVAHRSEDGSPRCNSCHLRDPATWRTCSQCGQVGRINGRSDDGGTVCTRCYRPPPYRCDGCGATSVIASRSSGRALCYRCYEKPRRHCGGCGQVKVVKRRGRDGAPDLCNACHWAAIAVCTDCGEEAPGFGASRGAHVCLRCSARHRLDDLLAAGGASPSALSGLRDAFLAAEQPRSVLGWLRRSPGAAALRRLVTGELELSHAALDALSQTPSLRHLRQLLIATGALPERHPELAALERHIRATVAAIGDPDDARLLRGYGTWSVLARLRRRPGTLSSHSVRAARSTFTQAASFLRWLHGQDLTLATCSQHDLDRWLARGPKHRRQVRHLLAWAAERGVARGVEPPRDEARGLPTGGDDAGRWSDARRLLDDSTLDPAERVVGTLVVLYAQPLTRIARLRLDDITEVDGDVHLSFGKDLVFMPEPLATFLRQLPWRRQVGPSGHAPGADQWLFPGRQAGRPQHPEYLAARLRAIGISPRASRNAALIQLGAQVPAKVLADLLNLHENTAVRWVKSAGGDWTNYAAARVRASRAQP